MASPLALHGPSEMHRCPSPGEGTPCLLAWSASFKPVLPSPLYLGIAKEPDKSTLSLGKKRQQRPRALVFHLIVGSWCGISAVAFPSGSAPFPGTSCVFPFPIIPRAALCQAGAGEPCVAGTEGIRQGVCRPGLEEGGRRREGGGGKKCLEIPRWKQNPSRPPSPPRAAATDVRGQPILSPQPFPVVSSADTKNSLGSVCLEASSPLTVM